MGKVSAIILAAGRGKRMNSEINKQFLLINGKPLLYYSLKAFEESEIDEIILVSGPGYLNFCREEIVEKYGFSKVSGIIEGGDERYNSVYNGLCVLESVDFVLIHDSARPMITKELVNFNIQEVKKYRACVTAVPSKDTIKVSDADGFVSYTPNRKDLWNIQTPQTFEFELIKKAYKYAMEGNLSNITDDAMILENYKEESVKIKLIEGSYDNIKITTSQDLLVAEKLLVKNV